MKRPTTFAGSALLCALGFALLSRAILARFELSAGEQVRIWLLLLWTGGAMAILFGAAALLAHLAPIGFRDVAEKGSVASAQEERQRRRSAARSEGGWNFASWAVLTGLLLILVYFVAWLAFGR